MRSGRREPELVRRQGRFDRFSLRDDFRQAALELADTIGRPDDHDRGRVAGRRDHGHLRDHQFTIGSAVECECAERNGYRLSAVVSTEIGRNLDRSAICDMRDCPETGDNTPEVGGIRQAGGQLEHSCGPESENHEAVALDDASGLVRVHPEPGQGARVDRARGVAEPGCLTAHGLALSVDRVAVTH